MSLKFIDWLCIVGIMVTSLIKKSWEAFMLWQFSYITRLGGCKWQGQESGCSSRSAQTTALFEMCVDNFMSLPHIAAIWALILLNWLEKISRLLIGGKIMQTRSSGYDCLFGYIIGNYFWMTGHQHNSSKAADAIFLFAKLADVSQHALPILVPSSLPYPPLPTCLILCRPTPHRQKRLTSSPPCIWLLSILIRLIVDFCSLAYIFSFFSSSRLSLSCLL